MARDPFAAMTAALVTIIQPVATDPRKLKPGELCRLLNSTPLGPVVDDRRLRAHRTRGGTRIGDGRTVDLLRYAAWLAAEYRADAPPAAETVSPETPPPPGVYERKKEKERQRNALASARDREVGEIPPPKNPARRAAASRDVVKWCNTYMPHRFGLEWPPDLKEVAAIGQDVMLHGGQMPCAMPRGGGKTTIAKAVATMAACEGHQGFFVLVGPNQTHANDLLDDVKHELLTNDRLLEDYPEVCIPIRNVGDIANRCKGQTHNGEPTFIEWGRKHIVLPTIKGSKSSGVVIMAKGITSGIRGLNIKGRRPDWVLLDDVQTDESARSEKQIRRRLKLIKGTIRGLAGPGKEVAIFAMLTVIQPDDVADQLLDSTKNPEWQGKRYKLLYKFPTNMELWKQYYDIRRAALVAGARGSERWTAANAFYKENLKPMNAGADIAWEARKLPAQLSALQFAMDLYFDDEDVFLAEYQNTPKRDDQADLAELTAAEIATKTNGLARGIVPLHATHHVGFIDVQWSLLYWGTAGFREDVTGSIVEYNAWPHQSRGYFSFKEASPKLEDLYPGCTPQAAVKRGLIDLGRELKKRDWPREGKGSGTLPLELVLVDWRDGSMTAEIAEVCRMPEFHGWMIPAGGRGIGPADTPMHAYKIRPGEKLGHHWHYKYSRYNLMSVDVDTNYWKSRTHTALATPFGNSGSLTFFGGPGIKHDMLGEHCTSETRTRVKAEKSGRTCDVWKLKPGKPDNHFFDVVVGCVVGASLKGCSVVEKSTAAETTKPPVATDEPPEDNVRPLF